MAREAWTDQRLDDLNERIASIVRRMEAGLKEAQAESVSIRQDMANQFAAQNRMIVQLAGGMLFGTMVIGFAGTIATIIVQT